VSVKSKKLHTIVAPTGHLNANFEVGAYYQIGAWEHDARLAHEQQEVIKKLVEHGNCSPECSRNLTDDPYPLCSCGWQRIVFTALPFLED
jgi:hypothetical protein